MRHLDRPLRFANTTWPEALLGLGVFVIAIGGIALYLTISH